MTKTTLSAITKTVTFDASIDKVWNAIASPEGIAAWFMPNDFQAVEGHRFNLQSPFGPSPCKILTVDPPHKLSFAWDEDGWIVSFELKQVSGKTKFTLIHDGWKGAEDMVPKANQKQFIIWKTMNEGWDTLVETNLRKVVEA